MTTAACVAIMNHLVEAKMQEAGEALARNRLQYETVVLRNSDILHYILSSPLDPYIITT